MSQGGECVGFSVCADVSILLVICHLCMISKES